MLNITDAISRIRVIAEELHRIPLALRLDLLKELDHRFRIVAAVMQDLSSHQVRLRFRIARILQQQRTRSERNAKLSHHAPNRIAAEDSSKNRQRRLGNISRGCLMGTMTQNNVT